MLLTRSIATAGCVLARQCDAAPLRQPACTANVLRHAQLLRSVPHVPTIQLKTQAASTVPHAISSNGEQGASQASAAASTLHAGETLAETQHFTDRLKGVTAAMAAETDAAHGSTLAESTGIQNGALGKPMRDPVAGSDTAESNGSEEGAQGAPAGAPVAAPDSGDRMSPEEAMDFRERLRRERISKANKGKTPWNKGKKHSPETIAKIRERTVAAMRRPEVLKKVHAAPPTQHSDETRARISKSVAAARASKRREADSDTEGAPQGDPKMAPESGESGAAAESSDKSAKSSASSETTAPRKRRSRKKLADMTPEEVAEKKEAHRKAISEAIKRKWQDPAYRAKIQTSMKDDRVQAKRASKWKSNMERKATTSRQVARQMLDIADTHAEAIETARQAKLSHARSVVAQAENALQSLQSQLAAFVSDPVMYQRAQQAIQQAANMVKLAKAQMRALQQGQPIPKSPHTVEDPNAVPRTPSPSPEAHDTMQGPSYSGPLGGPVGGAWDPPTVELDPEGPNGFPANGSNGNTNGTINGSFDANGSAVGNGGFGVVGNGVHYPVTGGLANGIDSRSAGYDIHAAQAGDWVNGADMSASVQYDSHSDQHSHGNSSVQHKRHHSNGAPGPLFDDLPGARNGLDGSHAANGVEQQHAGPSLGPLQGPTGAPAAGDSGAAHVKGVYPLNGAQGIRSNGRPQTGNKVVSVRIGFSDGGPRVRGSGNANVNGVSHHGINGASNGNGAHKVNGAQHAKSGVENFSSWLLGRGQQGLGNGLYGGSSSEDDADDMPLIGRDHNQQDFGEYRP